MDIKNKFSSEEVQRLERKLLFSYLKTINSWTSSKNTSDPHDALMQSTVQTLRLCADAFLDMQSEEEVVGAIDLAEKAIFSLAWELAKRMFFLCASDPESPPKDSTTLSELYRRIKTCSKFTGEDYVNLSEDTVTPVFSKAENKLFRNAVFEAVKELISMEKYEHALFCPPDNCLLLYNSPEDSKQIFLTLRGNKFIVKK